MNFKKAKKPHKKNSLASFWNNQIMQRFIKANLFMICCVAAGLLLIVYLGAFSCEVSWLLEARGNLPFSAYILCTQFFVVFVATTILIHGLVTGLPWGLFAWSVVIGLLSIPELVFVMIMTTQHWGLQSVHGLTELISYLIRLVINCFALICVIPTGLRWRRESQVLSQLQDLATRLQLQTPPPSVPMTRADSRRSSLRTLSQTAFENAGYQICEPPIQTLSLNLFCTSNGNCNAVVSDANHNLNGLLNTQNEFNASIFPVPYVQNSNSDNFICNQGGNRTQSLMDLRCTLPGMYNPRYVLDTEDKNGKYFNITIDDLKNNLQNSHKTYTPSIIGSVNDPIYCSIETKRSTTLIDQPETYQQLPQKYSSKHSRHHSQKFERKCISLENLDGVTKLQNDLAAYGHNLLQNYTLQQQYYLAMLSGYISPAENTNLNSTSLNPNYRRTSLSSGMSVGGVAGATAAPAPMQRRPSQQLQYYGGFGYANYTNPYITANSKLSLGNESDDYRKYRDVAL